MNEFNRYLLLLGNDQCSDFVEIPSILMEFFARDPRVLSSFAVHWKTGEKLSKSRIGEVIGVPKIRLIVQKFDNETFTQNSPYQLVVH